MKYILVLLMFSGCIGTYDVDTKKDEQTHRYWSSQETELFTVQVNYINESIDTFYVSSFRDADEIVLDKGDIKYWKPVGERKDQLTTLCSNVKKFSVIEIK